MLAIRQDGPAEISAAAAVAEEFLKKRNGGEWHPPRTMHWGRSFSWIESQWLYQWQILLQWRSQWHCWHFILLIKIPGYHARLAFGNCCCHPVVDGDDLFLLNMQKDRLRFPSSATVISVCTSITFLNHLQIEILLTLLHKYLTFCSHYYTIYSTIYGIAIHNLV